MDPVTASLLLAGGGTVLGMLGGTDEKKKTEAFPGQTQGIQDLLAQAKTKMNTPGQTSGQDYTINPSEIQSATTGSVLGKINNPTDYAGYSKEVSKNLYDTQKAQIEQNYADEEKRQSNMYNRLGLVSSTPRLQASQDLGRRQTTDINAIGAKQAYDDYNRQLEAKKFGDTLGLNVLGLGNTIGTEDANNQKFTKSAAYTDFARAQEEPLQWAQLAGNLLGSQQPYYPQETPSTASQVGMAGQDIGSLMLMYSMLGKGGGQVKEPGVVTADPNIWWGGRA